MAEAKEIMAKLNTIQEELDYIKNHMVDIDTVLSADDQKALDEARKELRAGETKSLDQVKAELGL